MIYEISAKMVRLRVASLEADQDARILKERTARREKLLKEARENPTPRIGFIVSWYRGARTIISLPLPRKAT